MLLVNSEQKMSRGVSIAPRAGLGEKKCYKKTPWFYVAGAGIVRDRRANRANSANDAAREWVGCRQSRAQKAPSCAR